MIYLLNTELKNKKIVSIGLEAIFGVGKKKANEICNYAGISKDARVGDLPNVKKNLIINYIEREMEINEDLRQTLKLSNEKQKRIKSYRGQRAKYKLPRRGQRTHTNARTAKKK
jgi:small subunit ribosomal protein S13